MKKVLFIASSGGHLSELMQLEKMFITDKKISLDKKYFSFQILYIIQQILKYVYTFLKICDKIF